MTRVIVAVLVALAMVWALYVALWPLGGLLAVILVLILLVDAPGTTRWRWPGR